MHMLIENLKMKFFENLASICGPITAKTMLENTPSSERNTAISLTLNSKVWDNTRGESAT